MMLSIALYDAGIYLYYHFRQYFVMNSSTFARTVLPKASLSGVGAKQISTLSLSSKVNQTALSNDLYDFLEPSMQTTNLKPLVSSLLQSFFTTIRGTLLLYTEFLTVQPKTVTSYLTPFLPLKPTIKQPTFNSPAIASIQFLIFSYQGLFSQNTNQQFASGYYDIQKYYSGQQFNLVIFQYCITLKFEWQIGFRFI
ncbi:hypothetical protein FGO68_gene3191 [Halteria grandinella]|uniref:Uncharacterized protein n=1 Tax=Halteria grandinella TaxID=5974 RepID=A0A8J8SUN7_HALGN|nr:hypothetical protein FGO68_gene3191 [Halteria grandinella]